MKSGFSRIFFLVFASAVPAWALDPTCAATVATAAASFERLTLNLSEPERRAFELQPGDVAKLVPLIRALKKSEWSDPVLDFSRPEAASVLRAAYQALSQNLISVSQFTTLVLRWQAQTDLKEEAIGSMKTVSICDEEGKLTSFARYFFKDRPSGWGLFGLSDTKLANFEKAVCENLPESERQVGVLRVAPGIFAGQILAKTSLSMMAIVGRLEPGHILYRKFEKKNEAFVYTPSFSVMQAFLNALQGESALRLVPEFGVGDGERIIAESAFGDRCLGIGFPGLKAPEEADGISTNQTGFTWHDYFHAWSGGRIPAAYRQVMVRGLGLIKEVNTVCEQTKRPYALAAGFEVSPSEFTDPFRFQHLREMVIDLIPPSAFLGGEPGQGISEWLIDDFGPVRTSFSGVIVRDLTLNPEWYRERGIHPHIVISGMGEDAIKLSAALRHQNQE